MKYLLALILLVNFYHTEAQKYKPLVEERKYWIYNHFNTFECFQMGINSTEIRYFSGDTIIHGQTYKKLVSSFVPINKWPLEITSKKTLCFMREDTLQRKVFLINKNDEVFPCVDGNEVCIWDFSLKIGDTLKNCTYDILYPIDFGGIPHNIIDTIINMNSVWGFRQKHFYTFGIIPGQCRDPTIFPVSYVEGFGMREGPIIARFGITLSDYCEGTLEECNIISSIKGVAFDFKNVVNITPNPSVGFIKIESGFDIKVVEIIDQNGKIVLMDNDKEVDVSHLISGLYFLKCISLQREMYYGKFIKL